MPRRIFIGTLCFLMAFTASGQNQIFKTNTGFISFRSDAPLEIIKASSNELKGVIDQNDMTFLFLVSITSFEGFNTELQKEHFYENYLESAKYPKATFTGKIIEFIDLTKPGTYSARAKGQLTIHGQTKERIIKTELISNGNSVIVNAKFRIPLVDHQIEVPRIVNQKIAQEIEITVKATLTLMKKS